MFLKKVVLLDFIEFHGFKNRHSIQKKINLKTAVLQNARMYPFAQISSPIENNYNEDCSLPVEIQRIEFRTFEVLPIPTKCAIGTYRRDCYMRYNALFRR